MLKILCNTVIIIISFILFQIFLVQVYSFNYENEGPDAWPVEIPSCAGLKQSPIDIRDWEVEYNSYLTSFNYHNYDLDLTWNCTHNGHSVVLYPLYTNEETQRLQFETDSLEGPFFLTQFHFHWGENDYQGSEHYIDGNKYPLEMHLVHKSKLNDLAVLGFLFTLSYHNDDNPFLDPLLQAVSNEYNASNTMKAKFKLSDIVPSNVRFGDYYRYIGSLTTPPCTEGVYWTIFEIPIPISRRQLEAFHQNSINKNFRYPQRLYKRSVTSSRVHRRQDVEESITFKNGCQILTVYQSLFIATLCYTLYIYF